MVPAASAHGGVLGDASSLPLAHPETAEAGERLVRSARNVSLATIMIVDDEPINIKVLKKYLRSAGYDRFVTTNDPREASDLIRSNRPDLLVLDLVMPHVSGLHILEFVRSDLQLAHLPVLILTAASDEETKREALELGATDFLSKPVQPADLVLRVRNALTLKAHHDHLADYSARLEREVRLRTKELAQSREEVIHVLACAAEYRDRDTGYHVLRVGRYSRIIARELGFNEARVELMEQAAVLHDVGKIGVSDTILLKPGKLDPKEIEAMRRHCEYGANILKGMTGHGGLQSTELAAGWQSCQSPVLKLAAVIALTHHEKWDGSGYPAGLSGDAIPIEGRIMAVADVFDALHSRRPYKAAFPTDRCLEIIEEGRGKHFDPMVLDAFFTRKDEIVKVIRELQDQ